MGFLVVSNKEDNGLLSIALDRDSWHHTMHKFNLRVGTDGFLNRERYEENIKGVLYLAYNIEFSYRTCKNLSSSKTICYPPAVKLNRIMNKPALYGKVFSQLQKEKKECVDYLWYFVDDRGYRYCNDSSTITEFITLCSKKEGEYKIKKENSGEQQQQCYVTTHKKIPNIDLYCDRGFSIQQSFTLGKCVSILFIGSKHFIVTDNDLSDENLKMLVSITKDIKKSIGMTLVNVDFMMEGDKFYLTTIEPFPKIPNIKNVKKEYEKYIVSKMKYVEKKVKERIE